MKNHYSSINIGMLTRKYYCHKCGALLSKTSRTRTLQRGDPDYKKYSRINHMHLLGDIELTEYDFSCPSCGKNTSYDDQCVIEKIQESVGMHTLSEAEIAENSESAKSTLEKQNNTRKTVVQVIGIILVLFVIFMWLKSGDFSFELFF